MAETDNTPQTNMAWLYAKQAREHAANTMLELAREQKRIEALEATVRQHEDSIARLIAAVRKLQEATRR